jgi:hypothetical protein
VVVIVKVINWLKGVLITQNSLTFVKMNNTAVKGIPQPIF